MRRFTLWGAVIGAVATLIGFSWGMATVRYRIFPYTVIKSTVGELPSQRPAQIAKANFYATHPRKADIVFVDLGSINWIPLNDPMNQLVHAEDGTGVHSVMIGGRMVVEDRRLLTVDLGKLARDAEAARERLAATTAPMKALFERLAPVVGSFCPALARTPYHVHRYVGS